MNYKIKTNILLKELKDYFNKNKSKDEDYFAFNDHPLSSIEDLMDDTKPAPWDHLTNTVDDEDIDIDIEEIVDK
tara:strand:- start:7996 stop:8217 length:222 start_codon:yes stop_codon:yes gene_type:complete